MKRTAMAFRDNGHEWVKIGEVTCEVIGNWADGTLTWEDEDGNYYSLRRIHEQNRYWFYFVLEAVN